MEMNNFLFKMDEFNVTFYILQNRESVLHNFNFDISSNFILFCSIFHLVTRETLKLFKSYY